MTETDYQKAGEELADRLLAWIKAGLIEKVGIVEIEEEARKMSIRFHRPAVAFRKITDWTVKRIVEKASTVSHP